MVVYSRMQGVTARCACQPATAERQPAPITETAAPSPSATGLPLIKVA
jgi:hypothetical protein